MFLWLHRARERERASRFLMTHQHIVGYTVSFTLHDLHKMDSRQLKMTDDRLQKLSTTQKKETTQNTAQQNYPGSVAFYHTRPGNVGSFYSSRAHTGRTLHRDMDDSLTSCCQSSLMLHCCIFLLMMLCWYLSSKHTSLRLLLTV